jgi:hypothetical protein
VSVGAVSLERVPDDAEVETGAAPTLTSSEADNRAGMNSAIDMVRPATGDVFLQADRERGQKAEGDDADTAIRGRLYTNYRDEHLAQHI